MALHVTKHIGKGGFSQVYEATRPDGQVVAVKVSHTSKKVNFPILFHEACALSILAGHPSIPTVYDWGRSQYFEYVTMDLLGTSLCDVVKKRKKVDLRTTLLLLDQMLDILEHMHSRHLVHLDIKPENFLCGLDANSGRIYLIDYGLACYYRDPTTLEHRNMIDDFGFIGTRIYASRSAHLGHRQSRRDDLESLVYTIAFLLRGSLPWGSLMLSEGTFKHREDRVHEKKKAYTGSRLFEGFPKVLADFADYVRGIGYDEDPDYTLWKGVLRQSFKDLGFSSTEGIDLTLLDVGSDKDESVPKIYTRPKSPDGPPPVSKGDYILIQILPHLTLEGVSNPDTDRSRWHNPSFTKPHWQFPARPVLVLRVNKGTFELQGRWVLSVLPLVHRPGGIMHEEEKRRFVRLGRESEADRSRGSELSDRVVLPSPEWTLDSVYHAALPRPVRVSIPAHEPPIPVHWKLELDQQEHLETMIKEPYLPDLSDEARGVVTDMESLRRNFLFNLHVSISPLLPDQTISSSLHPPTQPPSSHEIPRPKISWTGPRGILDEWVQIGRRRHKDDRNKHAWSKQRIINYESDSDDDFFPYDMYTWPAPHKLENDYVLENWEDTLRDIPVLVEVPIFEECVRVLDNGDEKMVDRDGKLVWLDPERLDDTGGGSITGNEA